MSKNKWSLLLTAVLLASCACANAQDPKSEAIVIPHRVSAVNVHVADDWDNDMPVKEQETIRKSFSVNVPGSPNKLEVNNVFGPIKVTGIAGDQIQMVVTKTIKA